MNVATTEGIRRFTGRELDEMVRAGIVDEDEPLELIDGVLETMSPQSEDHAWIVELLTEELLRTYGDGYRVRPQLPLDAGEYSRPEPDVVVLKGRRQRGRLVRPTGAEVVLAVEVAVSSQERDHRKALVYARAGVPILWILDASARRLEVHSQAGPEGYGMVKLLEEQSSVELPETERSLKIGDLLP